MNLAKVTQTKLMHIMIICFIENETMIINYLGNQISNSNSSLNA